MPKNQNDAGIMKVFAKKSIKKEGENVISYFLYIFLSERKIISSTEIMIKILRPKDYHNGTSYFLSFT
jgi:hypothetical protein